MSMFGNEHVNVGNEHLTNCSVRSIAYMAESRAKIKRHTDNVWKKRIITNILAGNKKEQM